MADLDIKLDKVATLKEIEAIAETVTSVAVPGPVPDASGETPIDFALAAVAKAQQAQATAWAEAVSATVPEQKAKAINAVNMLEATEDDNASEIARVYPESGHPDVRNV